MTRSYVILANRVICAINAKILNLETFLLQSSPRIVLIGDVGQFKYTAPP